jgi:membrane protein
MNLRSIRKHIQNLGADMRRAWKFAAEDVWDVELTSLSALRGIGVRVVRVVTLVFKGFKDDECSMHAASLTFSSLMAIVPVLALCLSMARGFGDADTAKLWIQDRVSDWTETFKVEPAPATDGVALSADASAEGAESDRVVQSELALRINSIVEQGFEKVENINFTKLGTVGLVLLIWMVIEVLGRVERSFNRVWGVVVGRSIWRRFTDYLSVLLILPILIAAAASLPVMDLLTRFLDEHTAALMHRLVSSGFFKNLTVAGMSTLAFGFLIMFMPNARVRFRAGLAGGFVTALLFLVWGSICAMIQVGAARYGKIYGSFAVVPILLYWVYMSWQIVLFGAEVAFAVQNCTTFKMEQNAREANILARMTLALAVVVEAARSMVSTAPKFCAVSYARENRVPVRFLNAVIEELVLAGYLAQLSEKQGTFALLKSPTTLQVDEVVRVVMHSGATPSDLGLASMDPRIVDAVQDAMQGVEASLQGTTIESLLAAA